MKGFTEYSSYWDFLRCYETLCHDSNARAHRLEGMESVVGNGNLLADMDILFMTALKKTFGDDGCQFNTYKEFMRNITGMYAIPSRPDMHYFFRPTGRQGGKLYVANEYGRQETGTRYCLQHVLRQLFFVYTFRNFSSVPDIPELGRMADFLDYQEQTTTEIGANEVKRIYDKIRRQIAVFQLEGARR